MVGRSELLQKGVCPMTNRACLPTADGTGRAETTRMRCLLVGLRLQSHPRRAGLVKWWGRNGGLLRQRALCAALTGAGTLTEETGRGGRGGARANRGRSVRPRPRTAGGEMPSAAGLWTNWQHLVSTAIPGRKLNRWPVG